MNGLNFDIDNQINCQPPNKWEDEMYETVKCTYDLLDELDSHGHHYKRIKTIIYNNTKYPNWIGCPGESEGDIKIDPLKHEPRSVAHELGHGFEERYRKSIWKGSWSDKDTLDVGQSMAEAIRYFVEDRMGSPTHNWSPNSMSVLQRCKSNFDEFVNLLGSQNLKYKQINDLDARLKVIEENISGTR